MIYRILKKIVRRLKEIKKKRLFLYETKNTLESDKEIIKKAKKIGFLADEYVIYKLDKNDPKEYISEYERAQFREKTREYRIMLDNKIIFYSIIRNFVNVSKIYAYQIDMQFIALEKEYEKSKILARIKENKTMVYKRVSLGCGKGFKLIQYQDGDFFINREKSSQKDVERLLDDKEDYLLEEFVEQSEFENKIFPFSVNTIRIITVKNKNGEYEVLGAVQRMGIYKNTCIDNAYAGGLFSLIDIKTGILSSARSTAKELFQDELGNVKEYSVHPVTNCKIKGLKIPNWEKIKQQILELHKQLGFMKVPFIAWDIALVKDGIKIIEGNASTALSLFQTFEGQRNKAIGKWLKEGKYIK